MRRGPGAGSHSPADSTEDHPRETSQDTDTATASLFSQACSLCHRCSVTGQGQFWGILSLVSLLCLELFENSQPARAKNEEKEEERGEERKKGREILGCPQGLLRGHLGLS